MQPLSVLSSLTSRSVAMVLHPRQTATELAGETLGLGASAALKAWEAVTTAGALVGIARAPRPTWPVDQVDPPPQPTRRGK